ncbi:hypothetical protein [Variovorax guangxiensis]|uniref:hypothetical protein n=1 Tax=Variovorax guangxiensis TaxID=1775474 RepID=UPI0028669497|nr:hypothetical protein [Variovorax guangxiensis]MDR6861301.1 hypothetical protein [Variovorax guangxiensis]
MQQLITILVEDSKTIRNNLIAAMAELAGVQVVAIAETASEAIAALQGCRRMRAPGNSPSWISS